MSVNKVILLGVLGKNPEIRMSQNGTQVGSFSLATSENWKDKNSGEKKQKTEWHNIVVFGNDAWTIEIKDLPYLQVGPYHTNTVAGLELAMDILRRRKNPNKQIFMITDGKPTCLKEGKKYYKNAFGLDRKITGKCLNLATQCKKLKIKITTFMITSDPYLQSFVGHLQNPTMVVLSMLHSTIWGVLCLMILKRGRRRLLS